MYEDVANLIQIKKVAFPRGGKRGPSETAIRAAEVQLSTSFPPSYRWWLAEYGGGQIGGDLVYGLDEHGEGRPDLVELNLGDWASGATEKGYLTFMIGNEEQIQFDLSHQKEDGEFPIVLREFGMDEPVHYADSFDEFLKKRILEVYG